MRQMAAPRHATGLNRLDAAHGVRCTEQDLDRITAATGIVRQRTTRMEMAA
jgi:hypothetical protein